MAEITITIPANADIQHNTLSGLQGGGNGEFYHLTESQHESILANFSTGLISIGNIIQVDDDVTLEDVVWKIDGIEFTVLTQTFNIPSATDDFYRIDIIVGNDEGELSLVQGIESASNPVTPITPADSTIITRINVFGDTIQIPPDSEIPSWQQTAEVQRTIYLEGGGPISMIHEDSGHFAALTLGTEGHSQLGGTVVELFSLTQTNFASADGITVPTVNQIKNVTTTVNGIDADTLGNITLSISDIEDNIFISPNEFTGTDTEKIQQACDFASANNKIVLIADKEDGSNVWIIDEAILLNSNTKIYIVDAKLKLSDICRDNLFRTINCGFGITNPELNPLENIVILGIGNVIFEGADNPRATAYNDRTLSITSNTGSGISYGSDALVPSEKQSGDWRSTMLTFAYTTNILIENIKIKDPHGFTCCFERCHHYTTNFIDLNCPRERTINGNPQRVFNCDGLKVCQGGTHVNFLNTTGHTDDNMLTIGILGPGHAEAGDGPGVYTSNLATGQIYAEGDDVHFVNFDNVHGYCYQSITRILNTLGSVVSNVTINNINDTSVAEDLLRTIGGGACIFGSFNARYGGPTPMGTCSDIKISNVTMRNSRYGVNIEGSLSEATITNFTKLNSTDRPAIYINPSSGGVRNLEVSKVYDSGTSIIHNGIYNDISNFTGHISNIIATANSKQQIVLTGTSGTANINIDGTNYLATFATSLTQTATNFVTTHAANILSAKAVTVTNHTVVLDFVHATSAFPTITITNVTGDLSGTVGTTTVINTTSTTFTDPNNIGLNYPASSSYIYGAKTLVPKEYVDDNFVSLLDFGYVTPDMYGAIGDGITDDSDAVQDAIDSGFPVLILEKEYLCTNIVITTTTSITGFGSNSVLKTNSDDILLDIQASYCKVSNLKIQGSGRGSAGNYLSDSPNQIGINIAEGAYFNTIISQVIFNELGGYGLYGNDNGNGTITISDSATTVSNCIFLGCLKGLYFDTGCEYNIINDSSFSENEWGVHIQGGNNPIQGGQIIANRTGIWLTDGFNDSHSVASGVIINHNIDYGILAEDIINGYLFSNCTIFLNAITLNNTLDVVFDGCTIKNSSGYPFTLNTTTGTIVQNNKFLVTPGVTPTANVNLRCFNNSYTAGTIPAAFAESIEAITNTGIFNINGLTASATLLRMRTAGTNRFLIGSDAAITAGLDNDLNVYVSGNNNLALSTNNVKRLTISGAGLATFSGNVSSNPVPTIGDHLTNKTYVDGGLLLKANLSGGNSFTGQQNITDSNVNTLGVETTSASMATQRNALKILSTTSVNMNDGFGVSLAGYIKDNAAVENAIGRFGWERAGADNTGKAALTVFTAGTEFKVFDIAQAGGTFYSPISMNSLKITSLANGTNAADAINKSQLDLKADLASPVFTGNPTAPTPTTGDNDTSIATTAFVQGELALIDLQSVLDNGTSASGIITDISIATEGGFGFGSEDTTFFGVLANDEIMLQLGNGMFISIYPNGGIGTPGIRLNGDDEDINISSSTGVVITTPLVTLSDEIIVDKYRISALNTPPATSTDTGTTGEIRYASDYIYVCIATNTWVRSPLTTW